MAPTKSIPAAFHSELSEYASLLRAIRTNSTLDIVPQLARAHPRVRSSDYGSDQGDNLISDEDTQLNDPEASREASEVTQERRAKKSSKGKSSKTSKRPRRKSEDDNWTRWPLLKEHCPLPEWTFDEEVIAVAEQCLRFRTSASQDPESTEDPGASRIENFDEDDIDDITLSPAHLSGLTSEVASKLTSMLSLLASHRPSATFTKHGRLAPMSWLDVLEVVGVAGIFDLATVTDVKERMEAIFGQSQSQIVTRMQVLAGSRRALVEAEASFGDDLSITQPPSSRHRKKQKHADTRDIPIDTQEPTVHEDQTSG